MLSQNQAKFVNSLKIKKYRYQHRAFIVEGEKSVDELFNSSLKVLKVFAQQQWLLVQENMIHCHDMDVIEVSENELKKISDLAAPNKVLAIAQLPDDVEIESFVGNELVLALDGIRDPGNFGTMIRTANWFGINKVICSPDCVDFYNPKVIQSTMGSFAKVQVLFYDLANFFKLLSSDTPIYGALLDAPTITRKTFSRNGVILIGSESHGISGELLPYISDPIHIPHFSNNSNTNTAESLNASIACAIICYEISKQLHEQ